MQSLIAPIFLMNNCMHKMSRCLSKNDLKYFSYYKSINIIIYYTSQLLWLSCYSEGRGKRETTRLVAHKHKE